MRIGIDALAVQSPHHAHRGIGRYARNLIAGLLEAGPPRGHEFVVYAHPDLPDDGLAGIPDGRIRPYRIDPADPSGVGLRVDGLLARNPDRIDLFLVLDPFEPWSRHAIPSRAPGGPRLVSVVYDLIPLIFQDEPEAPPLRSDYVRAVRLLRRHDRLLAISESTRQDGIRLLGLDPSRIANISGATEGDFGPPEGRSPTAEESATLLGLGIDRPFVLSVAGFDPRKNLDGLLRAFAMLPESARRAHQLVLTFDVLPEDAADLKRRARALGIGGQVVVTGHVSEAALRALYRRCLAFAFPSLYEGFGLPILEAMTCGAAVVAGDNSSQPEVTGDAALLVNAKDPADIAGKLARLLADPALRERLSRLGRKRAATYSWAKVANRALDAIEDATTSKPARRPRSTVTTDRRLRIAVFSPLDPSRSGVADYARNLLDALARHYRIDLYHDPRYVPHASWADRDVTCQDARVFRFAREARRYHGVVYQMGNSAYHRFLYPTLLDVPGVTTLHDFCLAGFHLYLDQSQGAAGAHLEAEAAPGCPDGIGPLMDLYRRQGHDPEGVIKAFAERGAFANARVFERSRRVIVHSPWCRDRIAETLPRYLDRTTVIPHGASARRTTPEARIATRDRLGLPRDAVVVGAYGFIHRDKMNVETVESFARIAPRYPGALLVFAGQEADEGELRRRVAELRLDGRVRLLGRIDDEAFLDAVAAADVGVSLRRPPTNGETSGALLHLLRSGVPTIATDVATFADYPAEAVRKVAWEDEHGVERLAEALAHLVGDDRARRSLGESALATIDRVHDWARVADLYARAIEESAEATSRAVA